MRFYIFAMACIGMTGCSTVSQMKAQTSQDSSTELTNTYDGASDSLDSLPDCTPELAGSLFWVRADKAGYDCGTGGQWVVRKSATRPDTEDETGNSIHDHPEND